ncbi:GL16264 [Drosophila persimilis]|uniref:GL16264 n=2 Tax=Drosophila persimilis TaxID=7234 RepID=B4HBE6_DROPE|nr:GL16264 [Drosophila persimilis]
MEPETETEASLGHADAGDSEDYPTEQTDRMQADLYDDDDDDDDDGLDDDDFPGENENGEDEQEQEREPESLPDPKGLVGVQDEEEDMGYDEDDERIALERPRTVRPRADEEQFVNEEGSGFGGLQTRFRPSSSSSSSGSASYRQSQLENIRKKLLTESQSAAAVAVAVAVPSTAIDLRESSGHFANDDEDGEDNDDGVDDEFADTGDGAGFFGAGSQHQQQRKSGSHYYRKNGNDAIKIISTPLGKVSIVYQQTDKDQEQDKDLQQQQKKPALTDFDALSPDPESSHRFPSPHPKITPVLTPDGKVALLYRGDSENSKYEPIRNLTHKFAGTPSKEPSKTSLDSAADDSSSDDSVYTDSEDSDDHGDGKSEAAAATTPKPVLPEIMEPPANVQPGGSFIIRPTSDSLLPMINRPLSEVLGIKKNQFQETRVRDQLPTLPTEATPRSLLAQPGGAGGETPRHFLTKVNLAEYPTSGRTLQQPLLPFSRDFDFSRDNTMLDERSRIRELEKQREREREHNEATSKGGGGATEAHTIANEQLLSKTEVINLAIVPQFDEDMERLQRLHENGGGGRRHHRARHRHKQTEEELSGIHCVMQVMMGIAAVSTVFGMLGTFFKQRILDQLRVMHW